MSNIEALFQKLQCACDGNIFPKILRCRYFWNPGNFPRGWVDICQTPFRIWFFESRQRCTLFQHSNLNEKKLFKMHPHDISINKSHLAKSCLEHFSFVIYQILKRFSKYDYCLKSRNLMSPSYLHYNYL